LDPSTAVTRGVLGQLVISSGKVKIALFCPLSPKQKALFFIEYSFRSMVLSQIGNHRVIHSQGCETAYNVWKFMSEEALNGIEIN
jgi:hypothetical protein